MTKVCILNSTNNIVENIVDVDDINNIPSFITQEGQIIATNHTGNIGDTWNGSSYDKPEITDDRTFEERMIYLREKRNTLLNQTDYIVIKAKETGTTIPTAWKTYRQSLRDITNGLTTVADVEAVVFPERPEA